MRPLQYGCVGSFLSRPLQLTVIHLPPFQQVAGCHSHTSKPEYYWQYWLNYLASGLDFRDDLVCSQWACRCPELLRTAFGCRAPDLDASEKSLEVKCKRSQQYRCRGPWLPFWREERLALWGLDSPTSLPPALSQRSLVSLPILKTGSGQPFLAISGSKTPQIAFAQYSKLRAPSRLFSTQTGLQ